MTPAERLNAILKARGISRRQASLSANIPPSTLQSAMERGKNISVDMLKQIATALKIPMEDLIGDDGHIFTEKMLDEELDRAFFYKLDEHLAGLTAREKDPLYRLTLAQAEEWAKYCKQTRKTPPEDPEEAPEGE